MPLLARAAAAFLLSVTVLYAAPLKENYRLRERGEWRDFVVAKDEVHRNRAPRKLPLAARSMEEVQAQAGADGDLVLYPKGAPHDDANRRLATRQVAVQLAPGVDPAALGMLTRSRVTQTFGRAERWVVLETEGSPGRALEAAESLARMPGVLAAEPQLARQQQRRSIPNDPLFPLQWHLRNSGQGGGRSGVDLNVTSVWDQFRGAGITIGIVDDGLAFGHPDLLPNYSAAFSYDFNYRDTNPAPAPFDFNDHGTACAGLAAAVGNNSIGVTGVAYEATLAGLRLIARATTDAEEASAFAFRNDVIDIKSNSWGPNDNAKILDGAGPLTRAAMADATAEGRGGRGSVIVWACGNGGDLGDNSNYDGYANQPEAIAIGALDNLGGLAYYSELGANVLAVAPSSGGSLDITTVDRAGEDGYNYRGAPGEIGNRDYTQLFGGTSAACPLAAGAIALLLQANPRLGWRDVREILISTASRNKARPLDPDWVINGAGFHFNHQFGAGLIDTAAAVARAQTWTNLGPRISATEEAQYGAEIIPDNQPSGVEHTFHFTDPDLRVEHAAVTVDIRHPDRGQLRVELESPSGTVSVLAPGRARDHGKNLKGWTFTTVRHWGERGVGDWKVRVIDQKKKKAGTLVSLKVMLFGSEAPAPLVPAGASLTAEQYPDGFYQTGEQVTAEFRLKNVSATPITGLHVSLAQENGVNAPSAPLDIFSIAPGDTVACPFSFVVGARAGETIRAALTLTTSGGNLGRTFFELSAGRHPAQPLHLQGTELTQIPGAGTIGVASIYPLTAAVPDLGLGAGVSPVVTKVTLQLHGLTHQRSDNVDVLLVEKNAAKSVMVLSDAGTGPVNNLELTFDDDGAPQTAKVPLTSGTYRPENLQGVGDLMSAPAPRKPYGTSLAVFNGTNPVDSWQIFIRDDQCNATGSLSGWDLYIDYAF